MERKLFIGSDQEVYIPDGNYPDGDPRYNIIRPVTKDLLEELQDVDYWIENYREDWVEAVRAERTDDSLEDWMGQLLAEYSSSDEDFPLKDSSFCEPLMENFELRDAVDTYFQNKFDITVGTWECSGFGTKREGVRFIKQFKY